MRRQIRGFVQPFFQSFVDRWRGRDHRGVDMAIYDRMERILNRHGFRRADEQTPQEFAREIASTLQSSSGPTQAATILNRIVSAFYRVRYGGQVIPDDDRIRLEESLSALELHLVEVYSSSR